MFYRTAYPSPFGTLTLACNGDQLAGLWVDGQKYYGGAISEAMSENHDMPIFTAAKKWLDRYFAGKRPGNSELPLAPVGSAFRQEIWRILCEIPYGETMTYGDIAKRVARQQNRRSMSSQAVGGAVGHNPISIIIPCHRVVGAGGSLTGFAAGIDAKIKLLELEGVDLSHLFVPKKGTAL